MPITVGFKLAKAEDGLQAVAFLTQNTTVTG
jgi:hypothetical protein